MTPTPQATPMDPETIVASDAFRALNHLIDGKAEEMAQNMLGLKSSLESAFAARGSVSVRVSYEADGRQEKSLPADMHQMERLDYYITENKRLEREIGDLMRFKLRLLNDYDFTHGDDTEQKAVFSPPAKSGIPEGAAR